MYRAERRDTSDYPQSFGRYRIRGVLGEGGMGRLYVAEQTGIEGFAKIVALKRILPHLADSSHFRKMFLNEARVAARLEHPNVVTTYELGDVEGTYFIAMEYLPGEDLNGVLARCEPGGVPVELAALLAQQSANGLHYAHELRDGSGRPAGLVHRDVNPSNIFVTYYGMVKLLDFGVVKASVSSTNTSPGVFKGKYAYCAPEQIQGETVDRRTDIFCLGIVLWECLTGQRLFDNGTDPGTIDAVRSKVIPPPSALRPDVPAELDAITLRALVRDRERRFGSAQEMSEALDRFLNRQPRRASPKTLGTWLETLFGSERMALKKAIAQGNDVESALAQLVPVEPQAHPVTHDGEPGARAAAKPAGAVRPRALWSTNVGKPPTVIGRVPVTSVDGLEGSSGRSGSRGGAPGERPISVAAPLPPARPRTKGLLLGAIIGLAAASGVGFFLLRSARPPASHEVVTPATGALELQSDPPGAQILVDGDPSGLVTPATLRGLRAGSVVEVRLDKPGYEPAVRRIEVSAGDPRTHVFRLVDAAGALRFEGVPPNSVVYLDNVAVEADKPVSTAVGEHKVRVEADSDVVFSESVQVRAGDQVVRIRDRRVR